MGGQDLFNTGVNGVENRENRTAGNEIRWIPDRRFFTVFLDSVLSAARFISGSVIPQKGHDFTSAEPAAMTTADSMSSENTPAAAVMTALPETNQIRKTRTAHPVPAVATILGNASLRVTTSFPQRGQ